MADIIFNPERLIALREINNLTQKQFAKLIKTTNRHISLIEKGKIKPNMTTFEKILNAFPNITAQYFFTQKNYHNKENITISIGCDLLELLDEYCERNDDQPSTHNPSLPFASGEDAPFSSPAWQGELVERLFKEIEGLKKEIKEIKQFFHIDEKPQRLSTLRLWQGGRLKNTGGEND